ncbi:MAG: hypothetical protein ACRCSB_02280 [Bacteroidales bacterium]
MRFCSSNYYAITDSLSNDLLSAIFGRYYFSDIEAYRHARHNGASYKVPIYG